MRRSVGKSPRKRDRSALKRIVDPFLNWHSWSFASCLEEIKKFPDYADLAEEWFGGDGSFEVSEETMYDILSADVEANSKTELSGAYKIFPAMPDSIAKRLEHPNPNRAVALSNEDSFDNNRSRGDSNSTERNPPLTEGKLFSDDYVDTEEMCKNLKRLKITNEFTNNSEEYLRYKEAGEEK